MNFSSSNTTCCNPVQANTCQPLSLSIPIILSLLVACAVFQPFTTVAAFQFGSIRSVSSSIRTPSYFHGHSHSHSSKSYCYGKKIISSWNTPLTTASFSNSSSSSSGGSSTSLQAVDIEILSKINNFYQTAPYTAAFLTCGIKASAADLLAQTRTMKQQQEQSDYDDKKEKESRTNNAVVGKNNNNHEDGMIHFINFNSIFSKPISTKNVDSGSNNQDAQIIQITDTSLSATATTTTNSNNNNNSLEYQRNFAFILYGGLYQGIAQEYIYNYLFPIWFGVGNDITTVLTKVGFDLIVISPLICIPIAYIVKAIIYRKDWWMDGIGKYIHDLRYKNLLLTYYSIWFPAGLCTFGLIPDHLRIAFIAFVSFFWLIILSTISSSTKEVA